MRRKAASSIALLAFALVACYAALKDMDFTTALTRAMLSAAVMGVVGYVAGFIAEKAVEEAVDRKEPLKPQPSVQLLQEGTGAQKEERK